MNVSVEGSHIDIGLRPTGYVLFFLAKIQLQDRMSAVCGLSGIIYQPPRHNNNNIILMCIGALWVQSTEVAVS